MEKITTDKSFSRWLRQLTFVPLLQTRWLDGVAKDTLSQSVTEAEIGHRGEIKLVIENTLPLATAYRQPVRTRAIALFSELGVWDTEENTGVLVYVNLCEHALEIVVDRGINTFVGQEKWQQLCNQAISGIKNNQAIISLQTLLSQIGEQLRLYYQLEDDPQGNELDDRVLHLK